MGSLNNLSGKPDAQPTVDRARVPITVLAPGRDHRHVLSRLAADDDTFLIASDQTLVAHGLLGLVRVGRAAVTAADVTSRTPGCECCQVRLDLVDAVRFSVLRRQAPARVVVVVDDVLSGGSGIDADDDPACDIVTCVHTIQSDSEIERLAFLDGVVVEVDACATSTRLSCGLDLWTEQSEAALAIADRIVVTDAELLTADALSGVVVHLQQVNRVGSISLSQPADLASMSLVDLDAWEQSPAVGRCTRGSHASESDSAPPPISALQPGSAMRPRSGRVDTVVLTRPGVLDPVATDAWLDRVVAEAPSGLLRLQAALRIGDDKPRVCVRGSRSAMRSRPETAPITSPRSESGDRDGSVVILVGRDLDRRSLSEGFGSIEAIR
ncbi:MAG: GTP-binding protein [Ilumatobacter sp.]